MFGGSSQQILVICCVWLFAGDEGRVVRCLAWAAHWAMMPVLEMGKTRCIRYVTSLQLLVALSGGTRRQVLNENSLPCRQWQRCQVSTSIVTLSFLFSNITLDS